MKTFATTWLRRELSRQLTGGAVTLKKFADETADLVGSLLFSQNKTPLPVVKPVRISGSEFLMFEQSENGFQKRSYFADLDRWIIEIRTRYEQESDKLTIEEALNTLKF